MNHLVALFGLVVGCTVAYFVVRTVSELTDALGAVL